jgi:hypothetical protein
MLTRIMLIAISLLSIAGSCEAVTANYNPVNRVSDDEYGSDYVLHYAVGAVVGGITWYYLPEDWHPVAKVAASVATSLLVGLAVELTDEPFDGRDPLDYGLGSLFTVTILEISF